MFDFYSESVGKESEQLFWETGSGVTATTIRRFSIGVIVDTCIMATQRLQNCAIANRSDKVIKHVHLLPYLIHSY